MYHSKLDDEHLTIFVCKIVSEIIILDHRIRYVTLRVSFKIFSYNSYIMLRICLQNIIKIYIHYNSQNNIIIYIHF